MDYKYYLFRDENYGDIYTNYRGYYKKKQQNENNSILAKTFFKTVFLCLALTLIPIICYGIFDVELLLWIACTFLGLTVLFAILSGVYVVKAEDKSYIADFKLTKEYSDQVEEYKLNKSKRYAQNLFKIIEKYNECVEQKKLEEKKRKKEVEKPQEVVVKLDKETTTGIVDGIDKAITKNIIGTLKIYLDAKEKKGATKKAKVQLESVETKEVFEKEKATKRNKK